MSLDHTQECGAQPPPGKRRTSNHAVPRELPSECNRPLGHEGKHVYWSVDRPVVEWERDER